MLTNVLVVVKDATGMKVVMLTEDTCIAARTYVDVAVVHTLDGHREQADSSNRSPKSVICNSRVGKIGFGAAVRNDGTTICRSIPVAVKRNA